ncbi:hypothetical protein [Amycolatopsis jiangsuensis]|uniref:Uncharacterized protein n=1 Tax=Amycolatopsis jiangsuensis TaxID=1181879 RepID=A0A840J6Y4_9PSEU|nr:hypothetical protein [Amycolatopsis jiangsuensis]MBB4689553.1 hypothetical protein [Amycolatopsis jiangsuensis]
MAFAGEGGHCSARLGILRPAVGLLGRLSHAARFRTARAGNCAARDHGYDRPATARRQRLLAAAVGIDTECLTDDEADGVVVQWLQDLVTRLGSGSG